ncbi:hypothetical protein DKT74_14275 [Streptomyces sp. ZEA17I]|uniref:hypothetical protein n=1 Tax=Streptomyces sp. ZEA17I TaxID=2202516 RepID=UPI000D6F3F60|nr:hypothetical protein [Streptomyces sp. ZEA17I]PWS43902.1 hypothetical protein DKT74_14275 [Streptomyces sp. ZEA17I]
MSEVVTTWTGRTACALQAALRMTNEGFAAKLGVAVRTVAGWHRNPEIVPRTEMQQILDVTLERANGGVRERFAAALSRGDVPTTAAPAPAVDPVVSQMAADMALMQARIDALQEQLGALALRMLT